MPHLILFMTPGNGLGTWKRLGTVERELKPYREYVKRGWHVIIATYDRADETHPEAQDLTLTFPPRPRYLFFLPWVLSRAIRSADLLKTNQSAMAWWYVWAARIHRKPILLRCGYVAGESIETTEGRTTRARLYQLREGWAFRNADFCTVPTEALRQWVLSRYRVQEDRISILPNFVEKDIFKPMPGIPKRSRSVVAVGNMTKVKNFELLVNACARARVTRLTIYGDGPARSHLERLARAVGLDISLPGRVANKILPRSLQTHNIYAQTSLREGHPKSLLEAMSCGMPCIGTRVPGIRDTIQDGVTGLLCDPNEESCTVTLKRLLDDPEYASGLGTHAAQIVRERFDFDRVFEKEYQIILRLVEQSRKRR